jgi:hypothetical protein
VHGLYLGRSRDQTSVSRQFFMKRFSRCQWRHVNLVLYVFLSYVFNRTFGACLLNSVNKCCFSDRVSYFLQILPSMSGRSPPVPATPFPIHHSKRPLSTTLCKPWMWSLIFISMMRRNTSVSAKSHSRVWLFAVYRGVMDWNRKWMRWRTEEMELYSLCTESSGPKFNLLRATKNAVAPHDTATDKSTCSQDRL